MSINHNISQNIREPLFIYPCVDVSGKVMDGNVVAERQPRSDVLPLGILPAVYPEWLGSRSFCEDYGLRFPYVAGSMANGIASVEMVISLARQDILAFYGAAGLALPRIKEAVASLQSQLQNKSFGVNLIHAPQEPQLEMATAKFLLDAGVRFVEASAFMSLEPSVALYSAGGLYRSAKGIERRTHVFAKVSRPEVAKHFMEPCPPDVLLSLVSQGLLTQEQAELASQVPVATEITVEADSGGHTDNRPLGVIFPVMASLKSRSSFAGQIRLGAAGGLSTPDSLYSAFALGADYVMTGTVNQSSVESGISREAKILLANVSESDVTMAPAADMFEMGVQVQVLKRGTLFASRAKKLYDLFNAYALWDEIPQNIRLKVEEEIFRLPFTDVWSITRQFWLERNAPEVKRAETDPKHQLALCFRWYMGLSSRWAIEGNPHRILDYQIWCGPAIGAFNDWCKGTFLEHPEARHVVQIALNLLEGAAHKQREHQMHMAGLDVFGHDVPYHGYKPRPIAE